MLIRDNAEDFLDSGPSFQRAWTLLQELFAPPSIEVFEQGYIDENRKRPHLSPPSYALHLTQSYTRAPAPIYEGLGCSHQARVSRAGAMLCPLCDEMALWPTAD